MKRVVFFLCLISIVHSSWAVQHVVPGAYPHAHGDMMHKPTAVQIRAHGSAQAATVASALGTKNIAVIIVQFPSGNNSLISGCPDNTLSTCSRNIQSLPTIDAHFTNMAHYFDEVSYHKIALTFKFFGPNTATATGDALAATAGAYTFNGVGGTPNHPMEYYGCGDEGVGCAGVSTPAQGANGNYLARDALLTARAGHAGLNNVANGGIFDGVIIIHAGNGNETTQNTNGDIWSIFYADDASSPIVASGGGGFSEADVDPEIESGGITSPLGVMCHEFGHSLGLPDLYNTSAIGGSSVVGKWELMDAGPYDAAGVNPSHMCAWDKMTLGWISPEVCTARCNSTLGYVETGASMLKLPVQNGLPQEYFFLEYRSATSGAQYDRSIPGTGILIWHVDDAITSSRGINATTTGVQNTVNSGSPHYGVSIVTANGASASGLEASGNPYGNGRNFTDPQSYNFSGQTSGINVLSISGIGTPTATLEVENLHVGASQSILKLVNYPNPAGKGYAHPSGPGHTTIQVQLARPPTDLQLNIYTLSGDLVRKAGPGEILHNTRNDDEDVKFVYEFVWDLKNGDGAIVAPGVYLYLIRADGLSKSSKAVIIR